MGREKCSSFTGQSICDFHCDGIFHIISAASISLTEEFLAPLEGSHFPLHPQHPAQCLAYRSLRRIYWMNKCSICEQIFYSSLYVHNSEHMVGTQSLQADLGGITGLVPDCLSKANFAIKQFRWIFCFPNAAKIMFTLYYSLLSVPKKCTCS